MKDHICLTQTINLYLLCIYKRARLHANHYSLDDKYMQVSSSINNNVFAHYQMKELEGAQRAKPYDNGHAVWSVDASGDDAFWSFTTTACLNATH